ncbi:MAG: hypothetical protein IJ217_03945 [Clostridia bacterium]|nr:hypothetical protein [Clostridia bacterium]
MSELKDKLTKQVTKISEAVSNEKERADVLDAVKDMVQTFTEQVVVLSEKHMELEKRVEDVFELLSAIEEEMISSFEDDLQGECPYCGETIPLILPDEDATEFECPKCHNMIELEMMFDEDDCGCPGCGGCGHDHDCEDCGSEEDYGEDEEE